MASPDFVRSTRRGEPVEWLGPGSPPRASYPTVTFCEAVVIRGDTGHVFMLEDGGDLGLPRGVVVNGDYEMQAALLAVDAAIDRSKVDLIGVAQFHHTLDVTNQDADSHNAQICITYVFSVAAADVDVEALAWAPPTDARWGSDAAVVLAKIVAGAVYPVNIVTTMEGDAAPANFGADSVRLREQLGAVISAAASLPD